MGIKNGRTHRLAACLRSFAILLIWLPVPGHRAHRGQPASMELAWMPGPPKAPPPSARTRCRSLLPHTSDGSIYGARIRSSRRLRRGPTNSIRVQSTPRILRSAYGAADRYSTNSRQRLLSASDQQVTVPHPVVKRADAVQIAERLSRSLFAGRRKARS